MKLEYVIDIIPVTYRLGNTINGTKLLEILKICYEIIIEILLWQFTNLMWL